MKILLAALFVPVVAGAAILPDTIGPYHRSASAAAVLEDRPVWAEYGLKDSESAEYRNGASKFTVTAWQLQDTTSALAAFDWQRPAKAIPSEAAPLAAETPDSLLVVHGNYVLSFNGYKPPKPVLDAVVQALKNVDRTSLPSLPGYLPSQGLVPNSERYIVGPVSLQKFAPAVPASAAAFQFGTEAQYGLFHGPNGDTAILIFDYPTPQIAMQRIGEFGKLPGAMVKRSGPLVSITLNPPDPVLGEKLLSQVRYLADVAMQEHIPTKKDNIGDLVINAFILTGILLCIIVAGGLMVGVWRMWQRRGDRDPDADALIRLHIVD